MYRYMPPKSSVWGHKLRRMSPAKQNQLFVEFVQRAVAEYRVSHVSLMISKKAFAAAETIQPVVEYFENLLGAASHNGYFSRLSAHQFDQCFVSLVEDPALLSGPSTILILNRCHAITKWRINGVDCPTDSSFDLSFGPEPRLSTFLTFHSIQQFRYIERILAELRFCRLNQRHLKQVRTQSRKKSDSN